MYRIDRNNFNEKPKSSTIYTPKEVSDFIFELLKDKIPKENAIFDPCCGKGSLLKPWEKADYDIYGVDKKLERPDHFLRKWDFFALTPDLFDDTDNYWFLCVKNPSLILCNPPSNGIKGKLAPEVWLDKIIKLFGKDIPIVLFVPAGFCPSTLTSEGYLKFVNGIYPPYPPISSRITLPIDIFGGVKFHSEILIFNIPDLQPHYFYHERK